MIDKLNSHESSDPVELDAPSRVRECIKSLQKRTDVPSDQIARIEYFFLPLLGYSHGVHLTLFSILAENPKFFVDVLCDIWPESHKGA